MGRSWARALAALPLVFALLVPARSIASAQVPPLGAVAADVAGRWGRGDADGIARVLSTAGIALHLPDQDQPAAGVRQARAALADLLARTGSARVVRVEELGGTPGRGFAELQWEVTEPGLSDAMRRVVFLGFVAEEDGWRIAEVRILR